MKLSIILCLGVVTLMRPIVAEEEHDDEFLELPDTHQAFARALKALFVEEDTVDEEHFGDEDDEKEGSIDTGRSFRQDKGDNGVTGAPVEDNTLDPLTTLPFNPVEQSSSNTSSINVGTPTSTQIPESTTAVEGEINFSETKERGQPVTDPSVITRYNRFLDAVFQRANKALKSKNLDTVYINFRDAKERLKKVEAKQQAKKKRLAAEASLVKNSNGKPQSVSTDTVVTKGSSGSVSSTGGVVSSGGSVHSTGSVVSSGGSIHSTGGVVSTGGSTDGMKVVYVSSSGVQPDVGKEPDSKVTASLLSTLTKQGDLRVGKAKKSKNGMAEKDKPALVVSMKGVSSFRRSKDVKVKNYATHKKTLTHFEFGPVDIAFTKQFKKAQRSIEGHVEQFKGRLVILLNPDGTANIQDFKIFAPKIIQAKSDLSKGMGKTFTKQKGLISPLAALRLRSIFRSVLNS